MNQKFEHFRIGRLQQTTRSLPVVDFENVISILLRSLY